MDSYDDAAGVAAEVRVAESQASPPYTILHTKNTPIPIKFTWSRQAVIPGKIGVRKDIYALGDLIRFRAKADILIPSGRLVYGFSAKDTIFHGRFSINIPGKVVAYQKNLFLPNGMNVSVSAGAQFIDTLPGEPLTKRIKPMCGIQLRFGSGGDGNIVYAGDGFSVKQRVPLPLKLLGVEYPKVDLETFTSVKFPQISSRYSVQNDGLTLGTPPPVGGAGAAGAVREDADTLCVHVQAINAVIRL